MNKITVEFAACTSPRDIHETLKKAFGFPEHYGANADALHDCLSQLRDTTAELRGLDCLPPGCDSEVARMRRVFDDTAAESADFLYSVLSLTGLRETRRGRLQVFIAPDRAEMGRLAGRRAAAVLRALLSDRETVNVIFAAAPSQNETLDALAASDVDFSRVNAFHMDEYVGLPGGAPQSFQSYLRAHLFDRVKMRSVHYINGAAGNIDDECLRYTELLRRFPTDLVCMGIGENGHIAFNDPGVADFSDPKTIKTAALDEVCRNQQVHDGCFPDLDSVPKTALTLTVPALLRAPHIVCTVPAASKAWAVRESLTAAVNEKCPATALRLHGGAMFCDADSASLLQF